jgi:tetratricopeptide (TPR) repeat protein
MIRYGRLSLVLAVLLLLPTAVSAQKDSKYTREASKYMGLAMTRSDEAQRNQMYQQALTHLREGMQQDAANAKVWLLAGTVLAAMGEMQEADQAFVRAVEMHPEYAEEVAGERESAWVEAFNEGIALMDAQQYDDAIRVLENAQVIYTQRPEALMNLGALYANRGDNAKAVESFRAATEATRGPLYEQLDAEQKTSWDRFREMAAMNVAQITAAQGVTAFEAQQYEEAVARFREAHELNQHSRDYVYNYLQSLWAWTADLEEKVEANGADAATAKAELLRLYPQVEELAQKTRAADPNNEMLFLIEARARKERGELAGNEAAKTEGQQAALRLLEAHAALPVTVDDIMITPEGEAHRVEGTLKNKKAAAGSPVQIEFTLVAFDGSVVGTETITVTAPAADGTTQFRGTIATTGDMAGWRYVVR